MVGCVLDEPAGTQTPGGGRSWAAVCWGMGKTAAEGTFVQKFAVCPVVSLPDLSFAEQNGMASVGALPLSSTECGWCHTVAAVSDCVRA